MDRTALLVLASDWSGGLLPWEKVAEGRMRGGRPLTRPFGPPSPKGEGPHHAAGSSTLSASVEPARVDGDISLWPHVHPLISGMSSPCCAMYCLCSMSLSRIACLTYAARAPNCGTRSMTS